MTSTRTEITAGITTFMTMVYIIIVNPTILATPETGMPFAGVATATVAICFLSTLFMGLYANLPFAIGPGMGLNAFFAYSLVIGEGIPWQTALGMVFYSGVLFVIISLTPLRAYIARSIPLSLRKAAGAGIGLFLAFIGLKNSGLVITSPATLLTVGPLHMPQVCTLLGIALATCLFVRRNPLSFIATILLITLVAWILGDTSLPSSWVALPDFHSTLFQLDIVNSLQWVFFPAILTLILTNMLDSLSTFLGVADAANLIAPDGHPKNMKKALLVDAVATLASGLFGTSPGTTFIESAAGVEAGGRRGLSSVVTALCFLPCFFLAPIAAIVPPYATAPILILVGALMFRNIFSLSLSHFEEYVPAFLTLILIPLTFSITQGILWGFVAHTALFILTGRRKEIHPILYCFSLIALALFVHQSM